MKENIFLFKYLKPYKNMVFLTTIFLILESLLIILFPFLFDNLINNKVYLIMIFLLLLWLFSSCFVYYLSFKISKKVEKDLQKNLFKKIISLNLNKLKKINKDELIQTLSKKVGYVSVFFKCFIYFVLIIIIFLGSSITIYITKHTFSFAYLIFFVFYSFITFLFIKIVLKKEKSIVYDIYHLNEKMEKTLNEIRMIKSLLKEDSLKRENMKINNKIKNDFLSINLYYYFFIFICFLFFVILSFYVNNMFLYFSILLFLFLNLFKKLITLSKNIDNLISIKNILNIKNQNMTGKLVSFVKNIEFKKVSFNNGGKNLFDEISFKIKSGEFIGITGKNSEVILELITKTSFLCEGEILINEMDIKSLDIRKNVSISYEMLILFSGTISENLECNFPNVSSAKKQKVVQICEVEDFILKQRGAYNANLEKADFISKQKLSLARSILADRDILILNNALSGLDTLSQNRILENLKKYLVNKIVIVISPSFENLSSCDRILVLENGKLCEMGGDDFD